MRCSLPEASDIAAVGHLWLTVVAGARAVFSRPAPRFSIGVSGVVVNPNDQILLLRHAFRHRHPWGLVSGWVNAGEAPANAMRRELLEEASLSGNVGPVLAIRSDRRGPSLEVVYFVRVGFGEFRPSAETPEGRWHDLRGALPDGLHPTHRSLIALGARAAGLT